MSVLRFAMEVEGGDFPTEPRKSMYDSKKPEIQP